MLTVTVVVLAGFAVVLMHRVWSNHQRLGELEATLASRANKPAVPPAAASETVPAAAVSVSLPGAAPTSVAGEQPVAAPAKSVYVDRHRKQLDELPSWLVIPEEKKEEMARLTLLTQGISIFDVDNPDPGIRASMRKARQEHAERQRQAEEQIQQLLGSAVYPQWKEYDESVTARGLLSSLNRRLGDAPLSEQAVRAAAASMTRAQQQAEQERQAAYGEKKWTVTTVKDAEIQAKNAERLMDLMRESLRPHLSTAQQQSYDQLYETMRTNNERQLKMQRATMKAREDLAREAAEKKRAAGG